MHKSREKIILFRFHKDIEVCKSRLEILKHFNPRYEIHGLYGGDPQKFDYFSNELSKLLKTIKSTNSNDAEWKWLHPDIALKHWYFEHGKNLDFDFLYDFEWDILALDSLDNIYPTIDQDTIALSALTQMNQVKNEWDWTSKEPYLSRYAEFKNFLKSNYNIKEQTYTSLGPGPYLSRKFLRAFSHTEDNDLVISEIAYPAFAQALNFKIINTGIMPEWDDFENQAKFFNCENIEINQSVILKELKRKSARRIFHPVKAAIRLDELGVKHA